MVCVSRHGWYTLYISKHLFFISQYQVYHGFLHILSPLSAPSIPCPLVAFSVVITGVHNSHSILQAEIYHSLSPALFLSPTLKAPMTLSTPLLCVPTCPFKSPIITILSAYGDLFFVSCSFR